MGPVSDTGRAMMASLQQAMAKGMPIDQAIAYVKGMAQQGVAPMVDLYAMLNQFQRLKQPQAQMPQGGTVKDQIAAAAMQRDQQEVMQRGLASMAAQRAPQEPMQQGLGSVPAPAMEQAQFAGGGIVAFLEGGPTNKPKDQDPLYPEETIRNIREQAGIVDPSIADDFRFRGMPGNYDAIGGRYPSDYIPNRPADSDTVNYALGRVATDPAAIGAGLGAIVGGPIGIPVGGYLGRVVGPLVGKAEGGVIKMADGPPRDMFDYTNLEGVLSNLQGEYGGDPTEYLTREAQARQTAYERMGLGAAQKAREADVAQQQAEAEQYTRGAEQTNLAQYFFDLAANASKPGARFLASAAQAAPGYGQRKTAIDEKTRLLNRSAKEGKLKLMEAEELRKAGYLDEAEKKRREGVKSMIDVGRDIAKERSEMDRARLSAKTQKEVAGLYITPRGAAADIAELTHIIATEKGDTPESKAKIADAERKLKIIDPKQAAAQTRLTLAQQANAVNWLRTQYKGVKDGINKLGLAATPDQIAKANADIESLKQQAEAMGLVIDFEAGPTAPAGVPGAPGAPQPKPMNAPQGSDPLGIRR